MPAAAGQELGANVLPFGLTTDVSAGALAAGAGSALAGGQASAGAAGASIGGKANGFAEELSSVAGQGKAQVSAVVSVKGRRAAEPVTPGAVAAQTQADVVTGELVPPVSAESAVQAVGSVVTSDVETGTLPVTLPVNDAQPGEAETDPLLADGEDTAEAGDAALGAELAPVAAAVPPVPVVTGDGAVVASVSADGVLSGAGPATGDAPSAPLPGTANGTAPVPAADADANANSGSALPAAGSNLGGIANGAEAGATQPATAGDQKPAVGAELQAAVTRPAPVTTERRWQIELPKEFRAQGTPFIQPKGPQSATGLPNQAAAQTGGPGAAQAAANAPGLQVAAATPAGPVAASVSAVAATVASADSAGTSTAPATVVTEGQVSVQPAETPVTVNAETGGAAAQAGNTTGASTTQGTAAANAGTVPVPQPAPATPQPVPAEQLLSGDGADEAGVGPVKVSTETAAGPQTTGNTQNLAEGPAANAPERAGPEPRGAALAAPVAAAALSNIAAEDADLPADLPETSISGEFGTATVRGGDLAGAMRTESLQAPSQSQSGQVATQVAAEIARNLKDGQTRFQMRFDPPELGRVDVEMKVSHDGKVQAHLRVDRPETLDMFLRDQRGLERALEAAGLNPDSDNLQFSLRQDGGQQFGSQQGEGGHQPASNGGGGTVSAEADPMLEDIVRMTIAEQRGGLDMKV